ncbi:MAG: DNA-formamidopyrimidine glycosylase [Erysipelotrichales bacterium]
MPELPEVETVVNTLKRMIIGEKIIDVEVRWDNIIDKISVMDFKDKLINQTIRDIKRYGKIIVFILDDYALLSHLRMEGKFYVDERLDIDKHSHVIFSFADHRYLRYHDTRKFGKMSLAPVDDYLNHPFLIKLAKEPFDMEVEDLYPKLKKKSIPIKSALLDQSIMAGLGNIYVDEVLFLSQIHPETKANKITKKQAQSIIENAIKVLNKAIELGGTTIRSYTSSLGVHGKFQNELQVHTKVNTPCPVCGTLITKSQVKGRGTYICHKCQRKK